MMYSIFILWSLVLILSFSFIIFLSKQTKMFFSHSLSGSKDGVGQGEIVPFEAVEDVFNQTVRLQEIEGKGAILLFVSNTCNLCKNVIDSLPETQNELKRLKIFLFIHDGWEEKAKDSEELLKRFPPISINENTKVIYLTTEMKEKFKLSGYPFGYAISKKGVIVNKGIINDIRHIKTLSGSL